MKRLLSSILALGLGLTPAIMVPLIVAPVWGQNQSLQSEELKKLLAAIPNSERVYAISADQDSSNRLDLNERSRVSASKNFEFGIAELLEQAQQGEPQQQIEILQKALKIARQLKYGEAEAVILLGIGFNLRAIRQHEKALEYYTQALPIFKALNNHTQEASTLNNIGAVYSAIGQPQKALEYFIKALAINGVKLSGVDDCSAEFNPCLPQNGISEIAQDVEGLEDTTEISKRLAEKAFQAKP